MRLSYKSRFSTGSSENILKSNVNDEFKQRSYQNSQILNQFKRKEISKKNIENQQSTQTNKSRFTSTSSLNKSTIEKSRVPLKKISAYDLNAASNNFDIISKSQDPFSISYFQSNNSDNDDFQLTNTEVKQKTKKSQVSNPPHVSFSGKIKTSQNNSSSFSNEISNNSNINIPEKNKENNATDSRTSSIQLSKSKINEDNMQDKIADLEKKNLVLMTDLRENCQLLNSIQKRLDQSTKDIMAKSNEIVLLKKQITELKTKSTDSKEMSSDTEEKSDETNENQSDVKDKIIEYEKMKEKLQEIQQQNDELIKNNEELAKKQEDLIKENNNQKLEISNLKTEQNDLMLKAQDLQKQNQDLKSQNDLFQLLETENNHNQELNSMISELKEKNKEYEKQLNNYQQENQGLTKIKEENEKLKQDIIQFQKENEILNENQTKLLKQNEELQKKYQENIEQNEKIRNDTNQSTEIENNHNNNDCNCNEKASVKYQMYDAYSDLSENESDDNNTSQDISSQEKHTPKSKQNRVKDIQQLQQQYIIEDFESQSYASDFSSEFSFTDGSDRNEIMNSPKASIIQQLLAANQKNKVLREANAKLEAVASTVMSDYTEALNKIQNLEKKKELYIDSKPTFIFENEEGTNDTSENEVLKKKINDLESKFKELSISYSQLKNAHLESFSNLIKKRQEIFKKEIEEINNIHASQLQQYDQVQNQLDTFLA